MALTSVKADIIGIAISTALQALSDDDKKDPDKIWKIVVEKIYAGIKADATITIPVLAGAVTGGTGSPGTIATVASATVLT